MGDQTQKFSVHITNSTTFGILTHSNNAKKNVLLFTIHQQSSKKKKKKSI